MMGIEELEWIVHREYPVDTKGVCCLCEGTFIVARMEAYEESEGGAVEFPIFCVCAEEDWWPVPELTWWGWEE